MKLKIFLLTLVQLFLVLNLDAQIETENNTQINSPDRGADPCNRNTQISTNPFNPINTEWYTMRNRFNWIDYVTIVNGEKLGIKYYDKYNHYNQNTQTDLHVLVNPFFGSPATARTLSRLTDIF